jgi:methyl-accepting chemotaxis protein
MLDSSKKSISIAQTPSVNEFLFDVHKEQSMKIVGRMDIGFVLVASLGAAVGIFGIFNLQTLNASNTMLYEKMTVPIGDMSIMTSTVHRKRGVALMMIMAPDKELMEREAKKFEAFEKTLNDAKRSYEATIFTDDRRELFNKMLVAEKAFDEELTKVVALARAGKRIEAESLAWGNFQTTLSALHAIQDEMTKG